MQIIWSQNNWHAHNNSFFRHIIALGISVVLLLLIMMIPYRLYFEPIQQSTTIAVELIKVKPEIESKIVHDVDKSVKEKVVEPIESIITEKIVNNVLVQKVPKVTPKVTKKIIPKITQPITAPIEIKPQIIKETPSLPAAGTILNSAYGKVKLYQLSKDFQVATDDINDFKFKTIEQPKWRQVTKLIDENLDKPRVVMDFYSPGIVGSSERLFDKISYSKKFTTRYGTKIYCGGIGPLVVCSW